MKPDPTHTHHEADLVSRALNQLRVGSGTGQHKCWVWAGQNPNPTRPVAIPGSYNYVAC